jgi:hypothetical protein
MLDILNDFWVTLHFVANLFRSQSFQTGHFVLWLFVPNFFVPGHIVP